MIHSNGEGIDQFRALVRSDAFKAVVGDTRGMLERMPMPKVYWQTGDPWQY